MIQSNESAGETYLLTHTPPLKLLLDGDFSPLGKMEFTIAVVSIFCAFAEVLSKKKLASMSTNEAIILLPKSILKLCNKLRSNCPFVIFINNDIFRYKQS